MLQFVNVNMRITRSVFTGITGTPFTLVFNNSNVQIDNTNFESNSGGSLLLRPSLIPLLAGVPHAGCAVLRELETIRAGSMVDAHLNVKVDTNYIISGKHVGAAGTPEGVIHGFGSFFTITDSNFTTNSGRQTGAITIEDGSLTTSGCIFNSNQGAQVGSCSRLLWPYTLQLCSNLLALLTLFANTVDGVYCYQKLQSMQACRITH